MRVDHSTNLVPNLDAKVLISINPGVDISRFIDIKLQNDSFTYILETLGGLNSCFLCRREGHVRHSCPILSNRPKPFANPLGSGRNKGGPAPSNPPVKPSDEPSVKYKLCLLSKAISITMTSFPKTQPVDPPNFDNNFEFGPFNLDPPLTLRCLQPFLKWKMSMILASKWSQGETKGLRKRMPNN